MIPRRRQLCFAFAAAYGWPSRVLSQARGGPPRVVYTYVGTPEAAKGPVGAFRQGMKALGYEDGRNVLLEDRHAARIDQLEQLIGDVIASKPAVVVVSGSQAVRAAKQATPTIPIVMSTVADPVGQGFVDSLARPGGNITGNAILSEMLVSKRLEILFELLPKARRIGILANPENPQAPGMVKALEMALKPRGLELTQIGVASESELDSVLAHLADRRLDAIIVGQDILNFAQRKKIAAGLAKARVPSVHGFSESVDEGGLVSYAASTNEMWRNAAKFVHRILQGAKPGEIPIEQATRMELVLNLKAAKALGIAIPQSMMLRADRVIE